MKKNQFLMSGNSINNSDKTEEKKVWTSKPILTQHTGEGQGGRGSERKGDREEEKEEENKEEEKDKETNMNQKKTWYSLSLFFHIIT